ncbi:hypothetical protein Sango_2517300 [Sesamum angolense]|uniref:Uncharacterized protein n=1 Tax=Sesamum angolense TaxID=2727404 RepID=A0AAE1W491_9LAMI|nr:hypothetical protein Sango_2517300 [Sesamum angolense]
MQLNSTNYHSFGDVWCGGRPSELQHFSFCQITWSRHQLSMEQGTLQSNSSSSLLPHVQRFPPIDGSPPNFFISAATVPMESHHQFFSGFDARLQLYYGDAHADNGRQKGKGKNS